MGEAFYNKISTSQKRENTGTYGGLLGIFPVIFFVGEKNYRIS